MEQIYKQVIEDHMAEVRRTTISKLIKEIQDEMPIEGVLDGIIGGMLAEGKVRFDGSALEWIAE